jgi:hypothetical protein
MSSTQPEQTSLPTAIGLQGADDWQACEWQFAHAKREMGAFITAVRRIYGEVEAARAAEYWIEFAESEKTPLIDGYPNWRHITIEAAGQLAKDHFLTRLSEQTRHGAAQPS